MWLVRFAESGFPQANRITLTKSCRRNNSLSDDFAHHVRLAGVAKFFAGCFHSFNHRRYCLRFEHSRSDK